MLQSLPHTILKVNFNHPEKAEEEHHLDQEEK